MTDATRRWREWQQSPWGRLRYTQASANLARHLPPAPATVLDLAGGDGADALRLARLGYRVTVVDESAEMLAEAERAFAEAGLPVRLVRADLSDLPDAGPGIGPTDGGVPGIGLRDGGWSERGRVEGGTSEADLADRGGYDVVLAHNVIQYLPDPAATLRAAVGLVAPGGLLSVIAINRDSQPLQQATLHLDPAGALAALDSDRSRTHTFDTTLTLFTADQVIGWLDGCTLLGHHGILAVTGYVADNDRKHDPVFFADLERLELALADRMPYPLLARFFHLVLRRENPGDGEPPVS